MYQQYLTVRGKNLVISVLCFVGSLILWPIFFTYMTSLPFRISYSILFLIVGGGGLLNGIGNLSDQKGPFINDWVKHARDGS